MDTDIQIKEGEGGRKKKKNQKHNLILYTILKQV